MPTIPLLRRLSKARAIVRAQFGRKPGIMSEPASGYIFANLTPKGNPSDESYVLPLIDKVEAGDRTRATRNQARHSVAGRRPRRQQSRLASGPA